MRKRNREGIIDFYMAQAKKAADVQDLNRMTSYMFKAERMLISERRDPLPISVRIYDMLKDEDKNFKEIYGKR